LQEAESTSDPTKEEIPMLKKIGFLSLALAAASLFFPVQASANEYHDHSRRHEKRERREHRNRNYSQNSNRQNSYGQNSYR
jgi:hypothetical protein